MPTPKARGRAAATSAAGLRRCAHRDRHVDRPPRRVGRREGIVEEHHDAVAGVVVERTSNEATIGPIAAW